LDPEGGKKGAKGRKSYGGREFQNQAGSKNRYARVSVVSGGQGRIIFYAPL
jgi:hypothetical protein